MGSTFMVVSACPTHCSGRRFAPPLSAGDSLTTTMERKELEVIVREALNTLVARDANLLDGDASEWSVAHRLAIYLEELLPGWNIDCEFNRQGDSADPKAVADGSHVRPDIVVHHRGRVDRAHNLLAVELKKQTSHVDHKKAQEYTRPPVGKRKFQYCYGLTIALNEDCNMTWFENGVKAR